MSLYGQILILIFVLLILFFVLELLRRKKINEATTLWWLGIIIAISFFTFYDPALTFITLLINTSQPFIPLILLSLVFILLMLIYFSMKISILSNQVKDLTQYIAIFKNDIERKDGRQR